MDFENKLKRMEEIATALRNNETPLEKSIELYQEGMLISKELEKKLESVKREIKIINIKNKTEVESEDFGDF